jgi:hypothetical protein
MRLSGVACATGTIFGGVVPFGCEIVADWVMPLPQQLKMQTRIRLSLILSAQLYSVAVWILDIEAVRA